MGEEHAVRGTYLQGLGPEHFDGAVAGSLQQVPVAADDERYSARDSTPYKHVVVPVITNRLGQWIGANDFQMVVPAL